jgi:hypothetical protein
VSDRRSTAQRTHPPEAVYDDPSHDDILLMLLLGATDEVSTPFGA